MVNYRECRIITLFEIFKLIDKKIDLQKIFLVLGGLKTYLFILRKNSNTFFFPYGFTDISCESVFNKFDIEHKVVELSSFINNYDYYKKEKKRNIYILPFSADILKATDINKIDLTTFGQSYLPIKSINLDERKIFLEDGKSEDNDWIDLDICLKIKNNSLNLLDDIGVYVIDKSKIKNNDVVNKYFKQSYIFLLKEVVNSYFINEVCEIEENFLRIGGVDAYDAIIRQFRNLRTIYCEYESKLNNKVSIEETNKVIQKLKVFRKYLIMEIRYFRQFILSGTDAYYRNEFLDVLKFIDFPKDIGMEHNIHKWKIVCIEWRKFGRSLNRLLFKRVDETSYFYHCIDSLISTLERIKELEITAMKELQRMINNIGG